MGSINHSSAITFAVLSILKSFPDVSTNPSLASIVPATFAVPPWANTSTLPINPSKELASIIPVLFTTPFSSSFTAFVVKYISPPFADIVPEFSTIASRTPFETIKFTKEFPFRFTVYSLAAVKCTFPFTAFIVPLFTTSLAANTTEPLFDTSIVPRLITDSDELFLK